MSLFDSARDEASAISLSVSLAVLVELECFSSSSSEKTSVSSTDMAMLILWCHGMDPRCDCKEMLFYKEIVPIIPMFIGLSVIS